MTDRSHLRIVDGGGEPEPDVELAARQEAACAGIKAATTFWVLTESDEGFTVMHYGDDLELAAVVEEVARQMKRCVLGLDGE